MYTHSNPYSKDNGDWLLIKSVLLSLDELQRMESNLKKK